MGTALEGREGKGWRIQTFRIHQLAQRSRSFILSLVPTSDVSDVSGIVSEIARILRSSGNQNDVSNVSRSVVGRKRKPSDLSDSDSVALLIPIATPSFDLH